MVDTISLRVHDLQRNSQLVKFLHKRGLEGNERRVKKLDDGFDVVREMKWQEYSLNYATGETYAKAYRNVIKSHNSNISYCFNFDRDFLELEFSMPKYFWGDNVHQLVPHQGDDLYSAMRSDNWFDMASLHWSVFRQSLRAWWRKELGGIPMETDCIEVKRIDLCFNYVFKTEHHCKTYLAFIREIRKKYARREASNVDGAGSKDYGASSVYYPGDLGTFKIYWKYPELLAHPGVAKPKSSKKVRVGGKEWGVDSLLTSEDDKPVVGTYWYELLELSKRILRFEYGFRPAGMKELWLRRNPEEKKFVSAKRSWERDGKFKIGAKTYEVGTRGKDFYLERGRELDKSYTFWLSCDDNAEEGNVMFTNEVFSDLVGEFHKQCQRFMLTSVGGLQVEQDRVFYYSGGEKYQASLKGISASRFKMLEALLRDRSWDEIERQGIMSRTQLWRYRKVFREIGFGEINVNRGNLTELDHTYRTYWSEMRKFTRVKTLPF